MPTPEVPSQSAAGPTEHDLLRIVTENARVGLVVVSPDRRYVYANSTYAEILGLPSTNLVGRQLQDVLGGLYEAQVRPRLDRAFAGEPVSYELHSTSTGAEHFYAVRYEPTMLERQVTLVVVVITDITDRVRSEEERRFQEAMLLTERELTLDGILTVDADSKVLSYNERFATMWGIDAAILDQRADETLLTAVHEKLSDPVSFMARVRELYDRHDEPSRDKVELVDGRVFDRYSAPMRTPDGRYYGRVWYFRDVTDRRQALAALQLESDRAQRYLDTAGVILLALDMTGAVTLVNRFACTTFGWSTGEMLGRDFIDLCVPPRLRAEIREKLKTVQLGDDSTVASLIVTRSGDERLIEWRTTFLRDSAGQVTGTLSSGADITDRRLAEEALREERDRAQRYLDTADIMLLALDRQGRVSLINRKGCDLLGWAEADLLGRVWADTCVPPRLRESAWPQTGKLEGDWVSTGESYVLTRDGRERLVEWRERLLRDASGQVIGTLSSGADVTERRSLEEQYHQAQKMEAIGRLAAGVAHDFNNLLTAILGNSQLLLAELAADDPTRAGILEIHAAGERAAALTGQLLAFSRKQIIAPTFLDLNAVIGGLGTMIGRLIGEDVVMKLQLAPGPVNVNADKGQLEQIIMNLAVNARDAMPHGGTLSIETGIVQLDAAYASAHIEVHPGTYTILRVGDTGTGMTPEVQARIFEPFFTTKDPGKGTGLGLATVHGMVMRSGGSIAVDSEVGNGTIFTIHLPHAGTGPAVALALEVPGAVGGGAGETILVVEDAKQLRTLSRRILERQNYIVLLAANAAEAIEIFSLHPSIDLVLSDVVMPGGSGPSLIDQLRKLAPGLKVLYMSGYTEDAISHHGVIDPGIAFLHKPFTAESLGTKVREALDRPPS